jgi:hypothetical protein
MWVTAVNIITLVLMLAVLGYVTYSARKLEAGLDAMLVEQGDRLRRIERDLDRVRQALDSISTGVMTIDIRQRMKKGD